MTDLERMVVRALEQLTGELFHAKPTGVEVARLQAITDPVVEAVRAHQREDVARDEDMRMNFEVAEKALRDRDRLEVELEAQRERAWEAMSVIIKYQDELAALQEVVRRIADMAEGTYAGDYASRFIQEKP